MDPLKAPIVATLLCLCFVRALCDEASASPSPEQEQEIQMLRSKVASLEDEISRRKEETSELESVVRERSAQMATLVGDLELLQKVDLDDESAMKANTHTAMLEKQIERLGNDLEDQIRKGESIEARAVEAERSLREFGCKLEHAEKTNIEQKKKIQDLSDRLQFAEDKLSILENEAKSKAEELAKKLVPVAKSHLDAFRNATVAFTSAIANCTATTYRVCRDAIQARTLKSAEFADNYWQRFCRPCLSPVIAASEPHLSRASVVLQPYTRPAASAWRSLVSFTSDYNRQVQNGVKRFLQSNQLLTPLSVSADKRAWITAPALFALPVLCVYKVATAIVRRKNQARKERLRRQAGRDGARSRKQERRVAR